MGSISPPGLKASPNPAGSASRTTPFARGKVEAEFADMGEQSLKNIARPLRVYRVEPAAGTKQTVTSPPALPVPDKPSIAVLPFANMSGDPEQEYFADGMVEEITTAISRLPWLFVI